VLKKLDDESSCYAKNNFAGTCRSLALHRGETPHCGVRERVAPVNGHYAPQRLYTSGQIECSMVFIRIDQSRGPNTESLIAKCLSIYFLVMHSNMLKRKPSHDADPHVTSSIFGARRQRKRLFRSQDHNKHSWQPETERAMTELLEFVLQHEEAFQKYQMPV
jgi:hypothetical protein